MIPNVIDISHHNTIKDFAEIKAAGILGVIHKCTEGAGYVDRLYAVRRKLATDAGLLWGAYVFNSGEAVELQVKSFISHADPDTNTLMALDFEDNPHSEMSLVQCKQFLQLADAQLGRKLVLYSGNRIKDLMGTKIVDIQLGAHRLWLPQYGPHPYAQASWEKPWLWQFSERGKLPGTDGNIDLNLYSGTAAQLAQEWAS